MASCLNTESFPSCLILGNPTGLSIGRVKDLDKMHTRRVRSFSIMICYLLKLIVFVDSPRS